MDDRHKQRLANGHTERMPLLPTIDNATTTIGRIAGSAIFIFVAAIPRMAAAGETTFLSQPANVQTCAGQSATFSVTINFGDAGELAIRWEVDDGDGFAEVSNPNATIETDLSNPGHATSSLMMTDVPATTDPSQFRCVAVADGIESISDAVALTVHSAIAVTATVDDPETCVGNETRVRATAAGGLSPYSFTWSVVNDGVSPNLSAAQFSNPFSASPFFEPTSSGTYTLRVAAGSPQVPACVAAQQTVQIQVRATPTVNISANMTVLCFGEPASLDAHPTGSEQQSFAWSIETSPNLSTAQFDDASLSTPVFTAVSAGVYRLRVTANDETCSRVVADTIDLTVWTPVAVTLDSESPSNTTCVGTPLDLQADPEGGTGAYTYQWSVAFGPDTAATQFNNAALSNPTFTPTAPGAYDLQLVATNAECGPSPATLLHIAVNQSVDAQPDADDNTLFFGQSTLLHANPLDEDRQYSYTWSIAAGPDLAPAQLIPRNTETIAFTPADIDEPGTYSISVRLDDGQCPAILRSLTVDVGLGLSVEAEPNTESVCLGHSPVTLSAVAQGGSESYHYAWSIVSGPDLDPAQFTDTAVILDANIDDPRALAFDSENGWVYWTDAGSATIRRFHPQDGQFEEIVVLSIFSAAEGIAVAPTLEKIYWADPAFGTIARSNLDGTDVETVVTTGAPIGVAIDNDAGVIYWTDFTNRTVHRADLDGGNVETLLTLDRDRPVGIAVDPIDAKIYWTTFDVPAVSGSIHRADLDGANIQTIVRSTPIEPRDVAVDHAGEKIYWSDRIAGTVRRADLDGQNRETLVSIGAQQPMAVAIDRTNGVLYWSDRGANTITRRSLGGSGTEASSPIFTPTASGAYALRVAVSDAVETLPAAAEQFSVAVLDAVPEITTQPQSVAVCVGEEAEFQVAADDPIDDELLEYQWFHGGIAVPMADEATLNLTDVTELDAGVYRCRVTNACGAVQTDSTVTLTVETPAKRAPLFAVTRERNLRKMTGSCRFDGSSSQVASIGEQRPTALAADPFTGTLYAAVRTVTSPPAFSLVLVDRDTGTTTTIAALADAVSDLAFHPDGTLYGVLGNRSATPGRIVTIDLTDGTTSPTNVISFGDEEGHSIAFDSSGDDLLLYHHGRRFQLYSRLSVVNMSDPGTIAYTRDYDVQDIWTAMAVSDDAFLAVAHFSNQLWSIDRLNDYEPTVLGSLGAGQQSNWVTGLAFAPQPEAPTVQIEIIDEPDPVLAGEPLTYTMSITNVSTEAIDGLALQASVPTMTAFGSATFVDTTGHASLPQPGGTGTVQWVFDDSLAAGNTFTVRWVVVVSDQLAHGAQIAVGAVHVEGNQIGEVPIATGVSTTVVSRAIDAALTATVLPPGAVPVRPDDILEFTAVIENTGVDLTDAQFKLEPPPDTRFVPHSATADWPGAVFQSQSPLSVLLGDFPAQATTTLNVKVQILSGSTLASSICLQGRLIADTDDWTVWTDDPGTPTDFDPTCLSVCGAGDFDCDADIDLADYESFHACLIDQPQAPAARYCLTFDFDGSKRVDLIDWAYFQARFGDTP